MDFIKFLVRKFFPKKLLRIIVGKYVERKGCKNERLYHGHNVLCPCCGKKFDRFMDFKFAQTNDAKRYTDFYKNTVCPYCFSYPRHRIICCFFDKAIGIIPQDNILMIAAERSIIKWFNRNDCHYTTADLFNRTADVKVDVQNMPFSDESWKLIICNHVLEHVPDYRIALKELRRVLKKDGILELTVPTDRNFGTVYEDKNIIGKTERIKAFGQPDHMRIFGNDVEKILTDLDFFVEVIDGNNLPNEIVGVIGPANYDDNRVYLCRKK